MAAEAVQRAAHFTQARHTALRGKELLLAREEFVVEHLPLVVHVVVHFRHLRKTTR